MLPPIRTHRPGREDVPAGETNVAEQGAADGHPRQRAAAVDSPGARSIPALDVAADPHRTHRPRRFDVSAVVAGATEQRAADGYGADLAVRPALGRDTRL